ncbi:MAG: adenine phosphoribosyltransferase [Myxococcales bacterium]|nr:adenine phosphoribosyltransferase [Myxococcales bacterium]
MIDLGAFVRDVPDFPRPGILFKDITPLLGDPRAFAQSIETLAAPFRGRVDRVACIDARGFLFGAPAAIALGVGLVPIRKPSKLPYKTHSVGYALEYGTNTLSMHTDAVTPGERVLLIDDVLATGGSAGAAISLLEAGGARLVGAAFLIELAFLGGRAKLAPGLDVVAAITYA